MTSCAGWARSADRLAVERDAARLGAGASTLLGELERPRAAARSAATDALSSSLQAALAGLQALRAEQHEAGSAS